MASYMLLPEILKRQGIDKKIDEFLVFWDEKPVFAKDLYIAFCDYAKKDSKCGKYYISNTCFGRYLASKDLIKFRTNKGVCYFGKPQEKI